ncbi:hypothetical protein IAT38_003547 [Cryptococcus sp. DSM 104549]
MKGELRELRINFRPRSSTVKRMLEQLVAAGRVGHPFRLSLAGSDNKVCEVLDVVAPWLAEFDVLDIPPQSPLGIEEMTKLDCEGAPTLLDAFYPMQKESTPPLLVPHYPPGSDGGQWGREWSISWSKAYETLWASQNDRGF